jgi:hypothetical protein
MRITDDTLADYRPAISKKVSWWNIKVNAMRTTGKKKCDDNCFVKLYSAIEYYIILN